MSDAERIAQRIARFGAVAAQPPKAEPKAAKASKPAKAAPAPAAADDQRKAERMQRFAGVPAPAPAPVDPVEEERKRKRAERFALDEAAKKAML